MTGSEKQATTIARVVVLCGSIRARSVNRYLVNAVKDIAGDRFCLSTFPIETLPHFNPDQDNDQVCNTVQAFRRQIDEADGVLISTPEYVFSIPGVIKNAIEWTVSTTVFTNKPVAIITASTSGKEAHQSLGLVMKTIYARLSDECRLLIQTPKSKLDKDGNVTDAGTRRQLEALVDVFSREVAAYQTGRR